MHEAGMKSAGKHFPGHGSVREDSHLELPVDQKKLNSLLEHEILPYIVLKNKLDAVMCAHIWFQNVDSEIPSFSNKWIKNILKERLGYQGIVFSDDLSMHGAGEESYYVNLSITLDKLYNFNESFELINIAKNLNPSDFNINLHFARCCFNIKNYNLSISTFEIMSFLLSIF